MAVIDQIGRTYGRACGDVSVGPAVMERLEGRARVVRAVSSLKGSTFGSIGGRPMGLYTAVSNTDRWELVRCSGEIEENKVRAAREWLEGHAAGVHYDDARLIPEILERQIRSHYVMRGSFVRYDDETNEDLMRRYTSVWPHAHVRIDDLAELVHRVATHRRVRPRSPLGEPV